MLGSLSDIVTFHHVSHARRLNHRVHAFPLLVGREIANDSPWSDFLSMIDSTPTTQHVSDPTMTLWWVKSP
jgi:hypothetical protein